MIGYLKPCSPESCAYSEKAFLVLSEIVLLLQIVLDLEVRNVVLPHLIAQFDFDLHRVKL